MNNYLSKSEIIETLAYKLQIDQTESKKAVDSIMKKMIETLANGERIEIRRFGTLTVKSYPPKKMMNPKTREPVTTEERHLVHFKPGEPLRNKINKYLGR